MKLRTPTVKLLQHNSNHPVHHNTINISTTMVSAATDTNGDVQMNPSSPQLENKKDNFPQGLSPSGHLLRIHSGDATTPIVNLSKPESDITDLPKTKEANDKKILPPLLQPNCVVAKITANMVARQKSCQQSLRRTSQ